MPNKIPRTDQIADLAFFINNPKAGLLHDPGVGKTITAGVYSEYCWKYKGWKVVWTQPKSLVKKNRDEILDCTDFLPEEVIMVRGTAAQRERQMSDPRGKVFLFTASGWASEWERMLQYHPDVKASIHDECHLYYSTHTSKRTQAWYMACQYMKSVIPMSGTLIRGRLSSVYPALHVIGPQFYGTYEAFMQQHAERDTFNRIQGWVNHEKLRNVLGAVSIRRSFESVYGKASPVIQVEKVEMDPAQRAKYEELEEMATLELEDRFLEAGTAGVMAIRCRQIMAHPERVKLPIEWDANGKPRKYQDYNLLGKEVLTGKDEAVLLEAELAYAADDRLVFFAALQPEQERTARILSAKGYRVGMINGNVSEQERIRIDQQFRDHELDFVVGSALTMGTGFNWNFLRMVVFVSLDYQDDNFTQAYKRGIRGHREHALLVKVLMYENSIDQRIFQIVQRKSEDNHQVDETKEIVFLANQQKLSQGSKSRKQDGPLNVPMKGGKLSM
ncbi:hypothetical protein Q3G72_035202 [Acer saccharum]|nr:hypothetical protein Q3G72_035202 [Acer saccharum]